jgi:hypothetical protein
VYGICGILGINRQVALGAVSMGVTLAGSLMMRLFNH